MNTWIVRFIVTIAALIVGTILLSFIGIGAEPVVRFPRVTEECYTNIHKTRLMSETQNYKEDHYNPSEGLWSNAYSSVQGSYDIFVIKSSLPSGARILKMDPIDTTAGGILGTPRFTDVTSGEEATLVSLETQDLRNGVNDWEKTPEGLIENFFHYGSYTVGGDSFYIFIGYMDSLKYPTVMLTWGKDANIGHPGTIVDTFETVSTEPPTEQNEVIIVNTPGEDEVPAGIYLFAISPNEFGEVGVEVTNDFQSWKPADLEVFVIYGDAVIYKVPPEKVGLYRGVEK